MHDRAIAASGDQPVTSPAIDVLIVDDDDDIRAILAMAFRHAGYTVGQARNGTEAFVAVCRHEIGCVVLDVMMPEINGFEVLNALRSEPESWDIKVVVLTCVTSNEAAREAWSLGADDYMAKPLDPDLVVARVRQVMAASRSAINDRRQAALDRLSTAR